MSSQMRKMKKNLRFWVLLCALLCLVELVLYNRLMTSPTSFLVSFNSPLERCYVEHLIDGTQYFQSVADSMKEAKQEIILIGRKTHANVVLSGRGSAKNF